MKRNTLLLIGVLSALMMALVGGAAVSAAPETSTVDAVFPIGPLEGDKYGPVADMDAAGNMIVAWGQANEVFVQRVNADGTPNGGPLQANTTADNSPYFGDLSADAAGNFVVVWRSEGLRGRCYAANGTPNGPEFSMMGATARYGDEPAVEMAPDGSFVAVWSEQFYAEGEIDYEIMGRRYSAACAPLGDPFPVNNLNTGEEYQPDIAMDGAGKFIVVWEGRDTRGSGVFGRYFGAGGAARGGQFRVNRQQALGQYDPSVGMDDAGNAVVAFTTEAGAANVSDVLAVRFNAAGQPTGNEFSPHSRPSSDPEWLPRVAVAPSGAFAVMWTVAHHYERDLWLQAYDAAGNPVGLKRPVATGEGDQSSGALATGNGDVFLAAWNLQVTLEQSQLYGRLMDLSEPVNAQVYQPTNDAYVMEARPNNTYGSQKVLQVKDAAKDVNTYVKFNVGGLSGTVESATLRLWVTDPGPDGGAVYAVSPFYRDTTTLWLETGLTWANAPVIGGAPLDEIGPVLKGQWVELDMTATVVAALNDSGRMSLAIVNDSANAVKYAGKEGAKPPELIVYTD